MEFDTQAIHAGEEPNLKEGGSGDVVVPIHLASTFARAEAGRPSMGYEYSRTGNPTRNALEKRLAALEGARHGLAFSSGLAAETVLLISLLKRGDHVVAGDDLYGGTRRLLDEVLSKNWGIEVSYADATQPEQVKNAIQKNTRLMWIESVTNPLLKIADIQTMAKLAHNAGALLVVDNTFASPVLLRPLELGADIVVHSTTKYLNGHSDSIGGAIMISEKLLHSTLRFHQNSIGAILSPFDSYLVLRGTKTLGIRMKKHQENAEMVAKYLSVHQKVAKVIYPGLPAHPQHELAKRQLSGFGGMISFELKGDAKEAQTFLSRLKLFALAESLGGAESLAEHPASMTHAVILPLERERIGLSDSLIRLSVGIEDAQDIIEDLKQALGMPNEEKPGEN